MTGDPRQPPPADGISLDDYQTRAATRREAARSALRDPEGAAALLSPFGPDVGGALGSLLPTADPLPDAPELARLAAWALGHGPTPKAERGALRSEDAWDKAHLDALPESLPSTPEERHLGALCLLARLGETYQKREQIAWEQESWRPHPKDADTRELWERLLKAQPDFEAGEAFKHLFKGKISKTFFGLGLVLRLPEGVIAENAQRALEQLDMLTLGAHLDIASRMAELGAEPVGALAARLPDVAQARVEACIARRPTWAAGWLLAGEQGDGWRGRLPRASGLAVLVALTKSLKEGRATPHPLGIPAWGVVKANRARMRGRLRAVYREGAGPGRPTALPFEGLPGGDGGLYLRTETAVARYAWAWAWREARRGFGFDLGRLSAPVCVVPEGPNYALEPLGEAHRPAIKTFLLLVLGRGYWEDLEAWIGGASSTTLAKSFYRCLKSIPDSLADPMAEDQRVRRYSRLQDHLTDEGLERYRESLRPAARAVVNLSPGRGLREEMEDALKAHWDGESIPFPSRGLPDLLQALQRLAQSPPPIGAPEEE